MAKLLDYASSASLMKKYGIHVPRARHVKSAEDAQRFYNGRPIALKVLSDKALHKSKSGVIKLNLNTKGEISSAYSQLHAKAVREHLSPFKILAQDMSENGVEIIIGGNTDAQFGKLILIGLGGIYVEAFRDFSMRVCPISEYDSNSMIEQLKSSSIVAGNPSSKKMLSDILMRVSKMLVDNPTIKELDLNPVILHKGEYSAVDVRILK